MWLWRRGQVPGGPLSDGEFEDFKALLRRYCAYELDQWDCLRTPTPYGPGNDVTQSAYNKTGYWTTCNIDYAHLYPTEASRGAGRPDPLGHLTRSHVPAPRLHLAGRFPTCRTPSEIGAALLRQDEATWKSPRLVGMSAPCRQCGRPEDCGRSPQSSGRAPDASAAFVW